MATDWQWMIVAAALLWAAMIVLRRIRQMFVRPSGGCGGGDCSGCSSAGPQPNQLISLSLPATLADDLQKNG